MDTLAIHMLFGDPSFGPIIGPAPRIGCSHDTYVISDPLETMNGIQKHHRLGEGILHPTPAATKPPVAWG